MVKFLFKFVLSVILLTAYCSLFTAKAQPTPSSDTVWTRMLNKNIDDVIFSKGGDSIFVSSAGNILIFDTETGIVKDTIAGQGGSKLKLFPDGNLLAINLGGTIRIWNLALKKIEKDLGTIDSYADISISPDGSMITSYGGGIFAYIWDVQTGNLKKALKDTCYTLSKSEFTGDGKYLMLDGVYYCKGVQGQNQNKVDLYDINTWEIKSSITQVCLGYLPSLNFIMHNGKSFVHTPSPFGNGNPQLYEVEGLKYVKNINLENWSGLNGAYRYSPDDKFIITSNIYTSYIFIWEVLTGKNIISYFPAPSECFDVDKNMKYITACDGKFIYLFNAHWAPTSVVEQDKQLSATITYPNPTQNIINIIFDLIKSNITSINIIDNSGKQYNIFPETFLEVGTHNLSFDLTKYHSGSYTLQLISGGYTFNSPIIINK